ncbi:MAG: repeat-containing protein [Enterovirga sp.]|nr:repeat-containing protein [Enterovirga sp.]
MLLAGVAQAREVVVTGSPGNRFGRILLRFDQVTKVQVKASNGVLVIGFGEPARIKSERLATELPAYVSAVRRDPDSTGLRLALQGPLKPNVLEAGERVYIDLLPPNWTGLPPGLPPEVVAELAERARAAEAKLKLEEGRKPSLPLLSVHTAALPTVTRFVFEPSPGRVLRFKDAAGGVEVSHDGPAILDTKGSRPKLADGVGAFEESGGGGPLSVTIRPAAGFGIRAFEEGSTVVVDLARPVPPQALPQPARGAAAEAPHPVAASPAAIPAPVVPAPVASAGPAVAEPASPRDKSVAAAPEPAPAGAPVAPAAPAGQPSGAKRVSDPPAAPARAPGVVKARVERDGAAATVLFPFGEPTPAAAFERGGIVTLLFDTRDSIDADALAAGPAAPFRVIEVSSAEQRALVRLQPTGNGSVRLAADRDGWRLTTGDGAALPGDALKVSRLVDESGRGMVTVSLSGGSRAHWLKDQDGRRMAVVTAAGRNQVVPLARSFVEFALPATLQGVVVDAKADDIVVGLGGNAVSISRDAGLSLSPAGRLRPDGSPGAQVSGLILTRDAAGEAGGDGILPRYYGLVADAANAPRSGRAEARYRLARFLVLNGMNEEAGSVLSLARAEDPVFARRRETALLSGIAAVRSRRFDEARAFLGAEAIGDDPEALLWRAVADSAQRRWAAGLAGFRRSTEILELYPDHIAGPVRLSILYAAIQEGDLARAESELAAIDRLASGSLPPDQHDFARARLDEAAGRADAAFKAYEKLAEEGSIGTAAEALLRWVAIASRRGAITRDAAIARLETLSVAWRGGDTEIGTLDQLARLYGEAGRWRDMFAMTRRANRYFPDHELTRALHDRSAHLLENLLLGEEGAKLTAVQALALYFDFKELAPIGRRGDEIVRRLADRLVELDLLDQASELLQYQVDKRLTGAARATVAARLAAIRLMNGKPLLALSALQGSRLAELPEDVRRFRFMLEARAQSDLSRHDLSLEIIQGEPGEDFERLRASILWNARRWREAGEAGEAIVGTRWEGPEPLSERDRADVVRTAIAYTLGDERIGLDRLRTKFGRKMMDSPDAAKFELLMRPGAIATREFRALTLEATRADSLRLLLSDWRSRHPDLPDGRAAGLSDAAAEAEVEPPRPDGRAETAPSGPSRG